MTYGILKSINTKDILYKKLVKADIHDEIRYSTLKAEFGEYKNILRRSIKKQNIYTMQEHLHSTIMTSNKHGQLLKTHYRKNITARRLINLS